MNNKLKIQFDYRYKFTWPIFYDFNRAMNIICMEYTCTYKHGRKFCLIINFEIDRLPY